MIAIIIIWFHKNYWISNMIGQIFHIFQASIFINDYAETCLLDFHWNCLASFKSLTLTNFSLSSVTTSLSILLICYFFWTQLTHLFLFHLISSFWSAIFNESYYWSNPESSLFFSTLNISQNLVCIFWYYRSNL